MSEDQFLCHLSELRDRRPHLVKHHGEEIVLVRVDDQVYGITNICPHAAAPLSWGYIQNGALECFAHMARFDLRTGQADYNPGVVARTYPVRVVADDVLLVADASAATLG